LGGDYRREPDPARNAAERLLGRIVVGIRRVVRCQPGFGRSWGLAGGLLDDVGGVFLLGCEEARGCAFIAVSTDGLWLCPRRAGLTARGGVGLRFDGQFGGAGGTAAARVGSRRRPMVARTEMRGIVKRSWRSSKASWEASKVLKMGLLRRAIVSAICMYTYLYILSRQQ
jgi:hypothetical protein